MAAGTATVFSHLETENLNFWSLQPLILLWSLGATQNESFLWSSTALQNSCFIPGFVFCSPNRLSRCLGSSFLPFLVGSHELGLVSAQTSPPIPKLHNKPGGQASVKDSGL